MGKDKNLISAGHRVGTAPEVIHESNSQRTDLRQVIDGKAVIVVIPKQQLFAIGVTLMRHRRNLVLIDFFSKNKLLLFVIMLLIYYEYLRAYGPICSISLTGLLSI